MPTMVSVRMRASSAPASRGAMQSGLDVTPVLLFDLLAGLPEEEVGTDRRAEDGDHRHCMRAVEDELRDDRAGECGPPRHVCAEHDSDVGEQRERRPFEHGGVACVAHQHFKEDADEPE